MNDLPWVLNQYGRKIYYNQDDGRGKRLAESRGNLNPDSLSLWNMAFGLYPWQTIVDVGSNYGEMLLTEPILSEAKSNHELKIIAFEPNPSVLVALRRTLEECQLEVDIREAAVSDSITNKTFFVDPGWSGTSSLESSAASAVGTLPEGKKKTLVRVTTLDEELAAKEPSALLMKIDIEGSEGDLLDGAQKLLSSTPNYGLFIEIMHMRDDILLSLFRHGQVYVLNKKTYSLEQIKSGSISAIRSQLQKPHLYSQDALVLNLTIESLLNVDNQQNPFSIVRPSHAARTTSHPSKTNAVIYTALMGNYEDINEHSFSGTAAQDVDYICFTDNENLSSKSWNIQLVEPRFSNDSVRSALHLKIMGPSILKEYDRSLWVDNSVALKVHPNEVIETWLSKDVDIAIPFHSYRQSVSAEFDIVESEALDDINRILEQMVAYLHCKPEVLQQKALWTGMMARRHNDRVAEIMNIWYEQVLGTLGEINYR